MSVAGVRTIAPFGRRAAPITVREEHGAYVILRCADRSGPCPRAGQFYMLAAASRWGGGEGERPFLPRAFSVMRRRALRPSGQELHFLIEDVGPGTNRLCELMPDDALLLVGPLGSGFAVPRAGRRAVLVGGGVGLAPLAIWQDELLAGGGEERGAGRRSQVVAPQAPLLGFRDRAHAPGARLLAGARVATEDGSVGHHGLVTDLLRGAIQADPYAQVYACGPPAMLEAVRRLCAELAVPAQLALEAGMACGFGACFGCVVPTREGYVRLCIEGPVLDGATLDGRVLAEPPLDAAVLEGAGPPAPTASGARH